MFVHFCTQLYLCQCFYKLVLHIGVAADVTAQHTSSTFQVRPNGGVMLQNTTTLQESAAAEKSRLMRQAFDHFKKFALKGKFFEMLSWGGLGGRSPPQEPPLPVPCPRGGLGGRSPLRNLRYRALPLWPTKFSAEFFFLVNIFFD